MIADLSASPLLLHRCAFNAANSPTGRVLYGRGMGDLSQTITIRSTMESDWPQIRGLRIENATDNPISYGATLHTTQRMDVDAWRLRGRRGEGPDTPLWLRLTWPQVDGLE